MVVGASRGLGRGIAAAFADAGSPVIAVARTAQALRDLATGTPGIEAEIAGAADRTVPGALLDRHQPDTVIVVTGASPLMRPLHQHTWETFPANWNTDVRVAFHWLREAPITPLRPGAVLPQLTPATGLWLPAVRAYAAWSGQSVEQYVAQRGEPLTPDVAGAALLTLAGTDPADLAAACRLTATGLTALP